MTLEQIFKICIENLAEYEKKQLITMLSKFMISHPSNIEAEEIYNRVIKQIIEE